MKKGCFVWLSLFLLLSSCKDKEDIYYINYKERAFEITSARVLRDGKIDGTDIQTIKLYLHTDKISFDVAEEKGSGASLKLELCVDSSDIKVGYYDVSDQKLNFTIVPGKKTEDGIYSGSYFKQMYASKIKKDTSIVCIKSGSLEIGETDNENKNDFFVHLLTERGDSISGHFKGTHSYINNVDGRAVGEVCIGDSVFLLQRGDMMLWGDIFVEGINYYELFFYSTNLRTTELGKFQKGLVFVLGLSSKNEEEPADGTYSLSRSISDKTAWTGRKNDNIDWGCYWYNYITGTTIEKAFITKDNVTLQKNGSIYDVTFQCVDQLGDTIKGYYSSDFKRIDLRN